MPQILNQETCEDEQNQPILGDLELLKSEIEDDHQ